MGRQRRFIAANTTYHTWSKCRNSEHLLHSNSFKDIVVQSIKETQDLFSFELNHFEIIDNELHLIITTTNDSDSISKIMQRIKSVIAKRYNRLNDITGPFWNERFISEIDKPFIEMSLDASYAPVLSGFTKVPGESYYSSYNYYIKLAFTPKLKIDRHRDYYKLGKTPLSRSEIYCTFELIFKQKLFSKKWSKFS